jgi:hypothetical protein
MTAGKESLVCVLAAGALLVNNESLPPVPRVAAYIPLDMDGTFARHVRLIPLQRSAEPPSDGFRVLLSFLLIFFGVFNFFI